MFFFYSGCYSRDYDENSDLKKKNANQEAEIFINEIWHKSGFTIGDNEAKSNLKSLALSII